MSGTFILAISLLFSFRALAQSGSYLPPEPVPFGCQNLGEGPARPIPLSGKIFATFLPEGKRYTKLRRPSAPDFFELGMLDLDRPGSGIQRLSNDSVHDAEIRASSDGKKIVWSVRPALDQFESYNTIMIANVDMSEQRVIAHAASHYLGIPSFVQPQNEKVMFSVQETKDEATKLMMVDLNNWTATQLKTEFKGSIVDPKMSPDGSLIVFKSFTRADKEDAQLYMMDSDGTDIKRLTMNNFKDEDPVFSPDGRMIVFDRVYGLASHKGQHENDFYWEVGLVALDLATDTEIALTEPDPCGKNELWQPTWSPDGELIMFTRGLHLENGEFTHDLWVMRKDGSDLQRVPDSEGIMFFDWVR